MPPKKAVKEEKILLGTADALISCLPRDSSNKMNRTAREQPEKRHRMLAESPHHSETKATDIMLRSVLQTLANLHSSKPSQSAP